MADRWWAALPESRRVQLHRMFDRSARQEPLPEGQMALDEPQEEPHAA
jgi:hypothetical protein